jgi:hypothetical protein
VLFAFFCYRWLAPTKTTARPPTRQAWILLSAWALLYLLVVPFCGQYIDRYQETGTFFPTNMKAQPLPSLWSHGFAERPGVISFRRTYLTFPLLDLLETPIVNTQNTDGYTVHRTSIWAQLYGQMNFAHFSQWPDTWVSATPLVIWLGRSILVLALIPTGIAFAGLLRAVTREIRALWRKLPCTPMHWLFFLLLSGYSLFLFFYTWQIRDFATMKPIFIFPAILGMSYCFAFGLDLAFQALRKAFLRRALHLALSALLLLFWIDIFTMILHLGQAPIGGI